jgi:hypothetical protein
MSLVTDHLFAKMQLKYQTHYDIFSQSIKSNVIYYRDVPGGQKVASLLIVAVLCLFKKWQFLIYKFLKITFHKQVRY